MSSIKTGSWFAPLPPCHLPIGISRSIPRRAPAGCRVYRKLAPGPWFNDVSRTEYGRRFREEILAPLDPYATAAELLTMAGRQTATLLCYEKPHDLQWCHRSLVAAWLSDALGEPVPELGFEHLPQNMHPLLPK